MYTFLDQELNVSGYYAESTSVVCIFCLPPGLGAETLGGRYVLSESNHVDCNLCRRQHGQLTNPCNIGLGSVILN
jgi:hypothetical protein